MFCKSVAFLLLFTSSCIGAPRMIFPNDGTINSGQTLIIQCFGKFPMDWHKPLVHIGNVTNSSQENGTLYESILEISKTHGIDTGNYTCYYKEDVMYEDNCKNENMNKEECEEYFNRETSIYIYVNDPEFVFLSDSKSLDMFRNSSAIIPCRISFRHLNVTLWKGNIYVPMNEGISYDPTKGFLIKSVSEFFSGVFYCKTEFLNRIYQYKYDITYHEKETFIDLIETNMDGNIIVLSPGELTPEKISAGETIFIFYIIVKGNPLPTISCSKDGLILNISERVRTKPYETDIYKVFRKLIFNDSGLYSCIAENEAGKLNRNLTIDVVRAIQRKIQPPKINLGPEINVHVRATLIIECEGEEHLQWIWPNNSQSGFQHYSWKSYISENTRYFITLEIRSVEYEKTGYYICCYINRDCNIPINRASTYVFVSTISFPRLFRNNVFNINATKVLPVYRCIKRAILCLSTNSYQPVTLRNNTELIPPSSSISFDITRGFIINDATAFIDGNFTCDIRRVATINTFITEFDVDLDIFVYATNENPYENDNISIICNACSYHFPIFNWFWKAEIQNQEIKIEDDNNLGIIITEIRGIHEIESHLQMDKVKLNNSGIYKCLVYSETDIYRNQRQQLKMEVKAGQKAVIVNLTPNGTSEVLTGNPTELLCNVIGEPPPNINWYKDGELFPKSNNVEINEGHITIKRFSKKHEGTYECVAENLGGKAAAIVILKRVVRKAAIIGLIPNGTFEVSPDKQTELFCDVVGEPQPTIEWLKDGELFNVSNDVEISRGHITIQQFSKKHEGTYECVATNEGGNDTATAILKIDSKTGESFIFTVTAPPAILLLIVAIGIAILRRKILRTRDDQWMDIFTEMLSIRDNPFPFNPSIPIQDQTDSLHYDPNWEFPENRLIIGKIIGTGAFGKVVEAQAIGIERHKNFTTVAVKMLKDRADIFQFKSLLAELKILIYIGNHINIVNLLGAVTKNVSKGELMVIIEYCCYGNIRQYLIRKQNQFINQLDPETDIVDISISSLADSFCTKKVDEFLIHYQKIVSTAQSIDCGFSCFSPNTSCNQTTKDDGVFCDDSNSMKLKNVGEELSKSKLVENDFVTTSDLLCFAYQTARGMEFLASRKLVHRDLSARNVLLGEGNIIKICDFGLTKNTYEYTEIFNKSNETLPLPIRWLAVESLRDKVFSTKSDVWSFGIYLWELFSLGAHPYPGIEVSLNFYIMLKNGYRMAKPDYAPKSIYEIMLSCWNAEPEDRPSFTELTDILGNSLERNIKRYYMQLDMWQLNEEQNECHTIKETSEDECVHL